jgi:pSer/pThr/pTyr-binding forkhead associated (FHA) protein
MRIIKIGKEKSNDICFENDPTVSRNHCQIFVDDDGNKFLTDLNSTNGTFVNNNKISEPVMLSRFDIVRAGNSLVNWKEFLKIPKLESSELESLNSQLEDPNTNIEIESSSNKSKWIILIILITSVLFAAIYYIKNQPDSLINTTISEVEIEEETRRVAAEEEAKRVASAEEARKKEEAAAKLVERNKVYPRPVNGFSPYDKYFGKGIYGNTTNSFIVKNSNASDAVVLLVNAYSKKKIRNEYVRKGANFEMTGVPNGTYYLEWFSGNDWSPNFKVGSNYKGGFRSDSSFTKTKDRKDWMEVGYTYESWTITLYNVPNGDVESQKINANDFFK